ncbi:unnamed protein product [Phytomonas sp. Hart1]|nr:unnamed protein product [Phytomonas sp. Hart1]|eukprot:CCW67543.1 unnamed protein product [Phytomonas sp. isolate Hart1]
MIRKGILSLSGRGVLPPCRAPPSRSLLSSSPAALSFFCNRLRPVPNAALCCPRRAQSSGVEVAFPIVQLPARTLWARQAALDPAALATGDFDDLFASLHAARRHYQYPSLSAPQIGWNVQAFVLFDGSVFVNPVDLDAEDTGTTAGKDTRTTAKEDTRMAELRRARGTGWAWEPCASCSFLMHYIERPMRIRLRALDARGVAFECELSGIRARMALHEMDHLNGVLFTRRVLDLDHIVPLDGLLRW